jgi:hypothetical protein
MDKITETEMDDDDVRCGSSGTCLCCWYRKGGHDLKYKGE